MQVLRIIYSIENTEVDLMFQIFYIELLFEHSL